VPSSSIVIRRLVVNADDLGLSVGVNDGIFDAHDRGILTSASLFANAPATIDAIRRARCRPSLGIGAHLTLVDGTPTLPPNRLSSLVQDGGRFRASWRSFVLACLRGNVALDQTERELTAQIDRIRAEGIRLTHLDAHKHVHAFPPLFAIVLRLATTFHIPVVRVPYERWSPVCGDEQHRHRARRQALANIAMLPWARRDYRTAMAQGVRVPQFVGRIHTGVMSAESLEATFRRLRPGITELMVHPGYVDDALRQTTTRLLCSREKEVELLCATATRDMLDKEAIQLIRHDLMPCGPSITRRVGHVS
jgi:hopanoid biosynthesis associated protein HpnK